ncbi:flagellar hook-associated protein FlgK [Methyloversatilis sp.]|uniref:flagellar hook-associated protein FlgK n=1 Tax=Methyloversatilis sp. TaxID=2569862 RepID=UPI002736DDA6|nr:flagellar hook-associated protein FlgK [Methyloversatilis sp.]MDP3577781.1 flagellar hook-associated protein FlgK [Methyloversatilis sp.]
MSSILNIGVLALQANQASLQTVSNNIANVNTPGYSRQSAVLQNVPGQFTGSGYFGKGVEVLTVTRTYSDFLTRQAAIAQSIESGDATRLDKLTQLEDLFQTGTNGLGASVSDMLNAFSDIVSAPTDLTARSVVLTRADEVASRFRDLETQINQLKIGTLEQLKTDAIAINSLANQIAKANGEIARALGTGQSPNDLLDQRDQLIRDLNKYVQTTNIRADDGTVGVFIASSQPLVLGTTVSKVSIVNDDFNNPSKAKLAITIAGTTNTLDESMLGGGEISGLLRFQNNDLVEAGNLLGRMALAIGTKMNEQQTLGLDLNGNAGTALFNLAALPGGFPSTDNTGTATLALAVQTNPSGAPAFVASDYELNFSGATAGTITRLADGVQTAFTFPALPATQVVAIDGLNITLGGGAANAGDRFVLKPFSTAANSITTAFASPKGLAMASPAGASAGIANAGTLTVQNLAVRTVPTPATVTLTFTGAGNFTRSDDVPANSVSYTYVPGQAIDYDDRTTVPLPPANSGWSLTLKGVPQAGDTFAVGPNLYPQINASNAEAMLNLRDLALFDGGPLTDGYASAIALIGTRVQSAQSAAKVSTNIATNLEKDRTAVSGVNLDEEAARMIQYQQAYQAAGKMMQVAQNLFDTLIQNLGR